MKRWGRLASRIAVAALPLAAVPAGPAAARGQCCGDCDGNGLVTIEELVAAVGRALNGCAGVKPTLPPITPTAGPSANFVDNGDGTVTDLDTGLIWEQKVGFDGAVDASNLHDADNRHPWIGSCFRATATACLTDADCAPGDRCRGGDQQGTDLTIFKWAEQLNAEGDDGFAGHADWRVPTAAELETIRDLHRSQPAIDPAFNGSRCGTSCVDLSDPACACTAPFPYWTASPVPSDPSRAFRIDFDDGGVVTSRKVDDLRVRAVRGP